VAILDAPRGQARAALERGLELAGWTVSGDSAAGADALLCMVIDAAAAPSSGASAVAWTREELRRLHAATKPVVEQLREARGGRVVLVCTGVCDPVAAPVAQTVLIEAVKGFARSLALEAGARGITVNTVLAPGIDDAGAATALRRTGTWSELAEAVLFLATTGTFVTGETLTVSGGATIGRLTI